MEYWTLCFD